MGFDEEKARLQREITEISVQLARLPLQTRNRDRRLQLNALKLKYEAELGAVERAARAEVVQRRLASAQEALRGPEDAARKQALRQQVRELEAELAGLQIKR